MYRVPFVDSHVSWMNEHLYMFGSRFPEYLLFLSEEAYV